MAIDVAILLSVGTHPLSGRPRRADLDGRALEIALRLAAQHGDVVLHALHAGDPKEASLRDYLGMGVARLTVLETPAGGDPLPRLIAHLAQLRPAITLAGLRGEGEEGSGFLPYALAQALGVALAPAIVALELEGSAVLLSQALRGGVRRRIAGPIPILATVDRAAPESRQSAYGRIRRGDIAALPGEAPPDRHRREWRAAPARKQGRRRAPAGSGSVAERLSTLTDVTPGAGRTMVHPSPAEAARAIRDFLVAESLISVTWTASGRTAPPRGDLAAPRDR